MRDPPGHHRPFRPGGHAQGRGDRDRPGPGMPGVRHHQPRDRRRDHARPQRGHRDRLRGHDEGPDHHRLPVLGQGRRGRREDRLLHRRRRQDGQGPGEAPRVRRRRVRDHRPLHVRPPTQGRLPRELQRLQLPQDMPAHPRRPAVPGRVHDRRVHRARARRRHHRRGDVPPRFRGPRPPAGHRGVRASGHPHVMLHAMQADPRGPRGGRERIHEAGQARGQPRGPEAHA